MKKKKVTQHRLNADVIPEIEVDYECPIGIFRVDWIDGKEVGLCSDSMTWTGTYDDFRKLFKRCR